MRWGGGGTPSIDEPDEEKTKVFPQPEIEFDDQDYVVKSAFSSLTNGNGISYVEVASEDRRSTDELPSEYTQIEYLESTGAQRINNVYIPTTQTKIEFTFKKTTANSCYIFGNNTYDLNQLYSFGFQGDYILQSLDYGQTKRFGTFSSNEKCSVGITSSSVTINSQVYDYTTKFVGTTIGLNLFWGGYYKGCGTFQLYSFKIFEGASETPEMDFVPCLNEDGMPGLYDTIGQKFYGNNGESYFNANNNLSGSGTESDPYQVTSVEELISMGAINNSSKYYILTQDISFNDGYFEPNDDGTCTYHDGGDGILYDWTGNIAMKFKQLDGKNHTLKNFYSTKYGLFASDSITQISNLKMTGGYVETNTSTGMLVKRTGTSKFIFENVEVDGVLYSTFKQTYLDNGAGCALISAGANVFVCDYMTNCTARGRVTMASDCFAGGLSCEGGTFTNCFNFADVKGYRAGGISGSSWGFSYFTNCENNGVITCTKDIAGGIVAGSVGAKFINCKNYGEISGGHNAGIASSGPNGTGSGYIFEDCDNWGKVKNAGICAERGNTCKSFINCRNYGRVIDGPGIARIVTANGIIRNCQNYGVVSCGLVWNLAANAQMIDCENHCPKKCSTGLVQESKGRIIRCQNYADATYGFGYYFYNTALIEQSETNGIFDYIFAVKLNGVKIINCIVRGNTNQTAFVASNDSAKIENVLFIGTVKGLQKNQYYGSDFSAFYVKWKTGYIGLKALDSVGVYMFAIPSEEYLQSRGFEKMG